MNNYTYFVYETTETSTEISVISAKTLEDAIAEARLLWDNYSENDKRKVDSFTLYRVPADTDVDLDNDDLEEFCDLANPTLEDEGVTTIEDVAEFINKHGDLTPAQEDELDMLDGISRIRHEVDFIATDGEKSVIMHEGNAIVVDDDVRNLVLVSANAFATIPEEVWTTISEETRAKMSDNADFFCDSVDGEYTFWLKEEVEALLPKNWRNTFYSIEEEAAKTLRGYMAAYLGDKIDSVDFRSEDEVIETHPDANDIVKYL